LVRLEACDKRSEDTTKSRSPLKGSGQVLTKETCECRYETIPCPRKRKGMKRREYRKPRELHAGRRRLHRTKSPA